MTQALHPYPRRQRLRYPVGGFAAVRIDDTTTNWRRSRTYLARNGKLPYAESIKRAYVFPTYDDALAACSAPSDRVEGIAASSPTAWLSFPADAPQVAA
jgi:hypothetical protein